jgi:NADH-quinone oxidoreductase subunit J
MIPDVILFIILALVAILSGVGLLVSSNAMYAALNLIINFAAVAVIYLTLGAPFIALSQVTVYAGAIMVLFLFVIMLLGAEKLRQERSLPYQQPVAIVLGVVLILVATYVLAFRGTSLPEPVAATALFSEPKALAVVLFDQYLLPFEVTSILLLVAMVGAIVLTRKRKRRVPR